MRHTFLFCLTLLLAVESQASVPSGRNKTMPVSTIPGASSLVVTDSIPADENIDVADALQRLIDNNPNRTLYFPDRLYRLSHAIVTPADPRLSVHLVLANYAHLEAVGNWEQGGALVRLGGSHPANNINLPGSNYGLTGGIIDGADKADGISIDGGRETRIGDVSIKHTRIGIHIKHGANNGSADADIHDVNIVGRNTADAVGVLVEGFDNTLSNMRIASVNCGIWLKSGGNSLRNIHPLYIYGDHQDYATSCGFRVEATNNWFSFCYSDQMATGFKLGKGVSCNFTDCFCFWYKGETSQTVFDCDGTLESLITGIRTGFHGEGKNPVLIKAEPGGKGHLLYPVLQNVTPSAEDNSRAYMQP